jgi:hypothetical protein
MDGGGAASPDAAICISPGAGAIVAVAPAGISKLPRPFLPPLPLSPSASLLADSHNFCDDNMLVNLYFVTKYSYYYLAVRP